jgi:hypothetical protein
VHSIPGCLSLSGALICVLIWIGLRQAHFPDACYAGYKRGSVVACKQTAGLVISTWSLQMS